MREKKKRGFIDYAGGSDCIWEGFTLKWIYVWLLSLKD